MISEGQVFVKQGLRRKLHRRIVTIYKDQVCYSTGRNKNSYCKIESFNKWIQRGKVSLYDDH